MNNPEKLSTIQWIHKTQDEEEEKPQHRKLKR
jgi:hypothetical protein